MSCVQLPWLYFRFRLKHQYSCIQRLDSQICCGVMFWMLQEQTFKTICEPGRSMLLEWYKLAVSTVRTSFQGDPQSLSLWEGELWIFNCHLKRLFSTTLIQAPGKKIGQHFVTNLKTILLSLPVSLIYWELATLKKVKYRCAFEELPIIWG